MTILIVARHGNTFEPGEPPRRIGLHTDIPLTAKGIEHGRNLGAYLKKINLLPAHIYTSELLRTRQMARHILEGAELTLAPQPLSIFNELDYGPDENKTEDQVLARLGQKALDDWDDHAIIPPGWSPDAQTLMTRWKDFADHIVRAMPHETVMIVTSNGIARFALSLEGDMESAGRDFGMKLATGAFGVLEHDGEAWRIHNWNVRP